MKKLFFLFVLVTYFLQAQTVIDNNYPYKLVSTQNIACIRPGKYIFRDAFDYINFRKKWDNYSSSDPVFFSNDEIGVIIKISTTSAGSYKIDSVVETENKIIITTSSSVAQGYQTYNMKDIFYMLAIKKTDKEIEFD